MVRPAPDLLARPAVCGRPASMILTRAPSRAPLTLAVKITPGPQICSRAPVGSPASDLRSAASLLAEDLGTDPVRPLIFRPIGGPVPKILLNCRLGIVINFGQKRIMDGWERVANNMPQ